MNNIKKVIWNLWHVYKSRTFAIGLLSVFFAVIIFHLSTSANAVYITDERTAMLKYTFEEDVDKILENNNIVTLSTDVVEFSGFKGNYGEIKISRSFPVYITENQITRTIQVADCSVENALKKVGIRYDSNDIINMPLNQSLKKNDHIVVKHVEYVTKTDEISVPFKTNYKNSCLIKRGRSSVIEYGKNGSATLTYSQTIIDGKVSDERLVNKNIIKEPSDQLVIVGADTPISSLDFGYEISENNVPSQYTKVITNAVATGYSAGKGAWGASGMDLHYGYVAVNPKVIPYGTKMYIASPDGSFVYGYAIAADTGVGLLQGIIDVDLFYETYKESALNGRQNVNIYILPN